MFRQVLVGEPVEIDFKFHTKNLFIRGQEQPPHHGNKKAEGYTEATAGYIEATTGYTEATTGHLQREAIQRSCSGSTAFSGAREA